jgi:hypothetical protein
MVRRAREGLEQDGYYTMTYRIRHRRGHYLWFETACRAIRETYTGGGGGGQRVPRYHRQGPG